MLVALAMLFVWLVCVIAGFPRPSIPGIGLPLFQLLPVGAMLLLALAHRKSREHSGSEVWATLAVGIMLVWLVVVIARVNLPLLSGPAVNILPLGAVLLMAFRHRMP